MHVALSSGRSSEADDGSSVGNSGNTPDFEAMISRAVGSELVSRAGPYGYVHTSKTP